MKRILFTIVCLSVLLISCVEPNAQRIVPSKEVPPKNVSLQNDKLIQAAMDGKLQDVQTALSGGADVNAKDKNGQTSLMGASYYGHTAVVKFLLDKGANINVRTTDGVTSLLLASQNGHTEVVKLLLEKGANVNAKATKDGKVDTPLSVAKNQEITELLEQAGAKELHTAYTGEYLTLSEAITLCRNYFGKDVVRCGPIGVIDNGFSCVLTAEVANSPSGHRQYQVLFGRKNGGTHGEVWELINVRPEETAGEYRGLWPKLEPWVSKQGPSVSQNKPSTQTNTNIQAGSGHKEPAKQEISWEDASQSGDIVKYAGYLKAHPKEHVTEIRDLVDKFLREKIAEAEGLGKKVLHNVTSIQANVSGGTTFWLGGGKIELGPVLWFSDPTNVLAVKALNGFQYVEGKGIGIMGDTVYCLGF